MARALEGCGCRVFRHELVWTFVFGEGLSISAPAPWRVVTSNGIAFGAEDDGHEFGLPRPVDGEARTNELLQGQKVVEVGVDEQTADLTIVFDGGARLDFFNASCGYEGWQASIPADGKELVIIAKGGGGLTAWRPPSK